MIVNVVLFITLLAYSFIVSQSFMYILTLRGVSMELDFSSYLELRKRIDHHMRQKFKYAVYGSLLASVALVAVTVPEPGSIRFVGALIAFICIVVDTVLTVKGNIPINAEINSWTQAKHPDNWNDFRVKWLRIFRYRQTANSIGYISLLVAAIFG